MKNQSKNHVRSRLWQRVLCLLVAFTMLVIAIPTSLAVSAAEEATVKVIAFQTSSRYDLGIDAENVRIGWRIETARRGYYQSAYRVTVKEAATGDTAWDSGWVESDIQIGITPEGLKPETIYTYTVNIKDQNGIESGESEAATFETAPAHVEGAWLTSSRLLRKSFELDQPLENVDRARCYLSSTAFMQIRLNGEKVGDLVMGPKKSVKDLVTYYNTFDITSMLAEGENVVGAYVSYMASNGNSLCGMLRIYYKDGSVQTVATGGDWSYRGTSDVTRENYFSGEDIDASLRDGWDKPGYKQSRDWRKAAIAGVELSEGVMTIPSNAGVFKSSESVSGDYTIEVVWAVEQLATGLQFGTTSSASCLWQIQPGTLRVHFPGWSQVQNVSVPEVKTGEMVTMRIEIKGDSVTTFINDRKVHEAGIPADQTNGALGIRSALNEKGSFDRVTVSKGGQVIWEDTFDTLDSTKWSYPPVPELKPAVSGTKIVDEYKPASVTKLGSSYIVDFGQNMQGYVRLTTQGKKGTGYTIEYSELLAENGDIFANTTAHYPKHVYTLSGGADVIEPYFFTTGFRYVKVTISDGSELNADDLTACFVSDDLDQTGFFESSNDRLNMVYHMYLMSQRSCLMSNYHDCPQREKNGWTGDASVIKEACALAFGDISTAEAYLETMLMNINEEGRPQIVVPMASTAESGAAFDITWASAYFEFPYQLYMYTGDTYYIYRSYESLLKIFDYTKRTYDGDGDGIMTHNVYGDWLGYDWHDGLLDTGFISAVYFYYCGSILQDMMNVIGAEDADFTAYMTKMEAALQKQYAKSSCYCDRYQTSNALALDLGLATDENRAAVLEMLVKACERNDSTLRTGVLGTKALYGALSAGNQHKLLLDMTISSKKCSFGYMIDNGATTLWEYWDKAGETFGSVAEQGFCYFDSQNHVMHGGGPATWMLQGLGGITQTSAAFKTMTYRPGIESELSYVNTTVNTLVGKTLSDWTYENGVLTWNIEVPANTTATVIIPISDTESITESGVDIMEKNAEGITYVGTNESGEYIYTVGGGSYSFVVGSADGETVEPETESEAESKTEPSTEPETELSTESETGPSAESETEPSTESGVEPETEARTEILTEPVAETETAPSEEEKTETPSVTQAPTTEASTNTQTDAGTPEQGCGSSVSVGASVILGTACAAVALKKRREE